MHDRVCVTERAIIQRINRKLEPEDRKVKTARSARMERDYGRYYMIDIRRNAIADWHVDLDKLGRELNVLGAWEKVAAE
jgi:hypothetical protein